ncbi:MAG TPA: 16S rRNA (cytosine(1402)-N(4))-methyltransferase RsmH [Cyclobacteriaceae bacterium]|nr:16S rRNA (cytosine(1402)-N(4))-methyltransferase RsmH [Cyclobacteriaceae bacterium]
MTKKANEGQESDNTRSAYHRPVMLKECISALNIKSDGVYVDATFGGGGHALAILENIREGRLIAFDQDEDARQQAERIASRSFTFCHTNFRYLKKYLKLNGVSKVDGVLADLGVSSHQIDSPERGFSTRYDGPLDMRMHKGGSLTAAKVLNDYPEVELHKIFGMYGEIRNARTAARTVVQHRVNKKFMRTSDLKNALSALAPKGKENRYFAQVFQALRIEVNEEMKALEDFLHQCGEVINKGGRLVVLSYHSLEDRMVKNYLSKGKVFGEVEKDFFGNEIKPFLPITRRPLEASEEEIDENSRARSAKLRIGERI